VLRDLTLENPIRAIREISQDVECARRVRLANGREMRALDIQIEYLQRAQRFRDSRGLQPEEDLALEMWEHCLKGLESDPLSLWRECDWVAKYRLVEEVRKRHDLPLSHPKVAMVDLMYHDVDRSRGLFYKLQDHDQVDRMCTDADISTAMTLAPQTTRARLRGAFVRRAKERRRDFTVDWVHLKLNDQAQRTVLLKDPFRSHDERVERLIASL
jgi:proteasome accessory factor A